MQRIKRRRGEEDSVDPALLIGRWRYGSLSACGCKVIGSVAALCSGESSSWEDDLGGG